MLMKYYLALPVLTGTAHSKWGLMAKYWDKLRTSGFIIVDDYEVACVLFYSPFPLLSSAKGGEQGMGGCDMYY